MNNRAESISPVYSKNKEIMAKEKIDDWFEMAKELAKAERELKIEHRSATSHVRALAMADRLA